MRGARKQVRACASAPIAHSVLIRAQWDQLYARGMRIALISAANRQQSGLGEVLAVRRKKRRLNEMERRTNGNAETGASKLVKAALALAIIGAINWGLIGFFNWNLVDAIFGGGSAETTSTVSRIIYALVGLAGLAAIPLLKAATSIGHHGMQSHPR
jgi:uncharacterized membrane protein YuzA (DUF378 family)